MSQVTSKPWGYEILRSCTDKQAVKLIKIDAGHRTSLQYHEKKSEVLIVSQGTALFELYDKDRKPLIASDALYQEGGYLIVDPGQIHRTKAIGSDLYLIEVSTPELDDIVRLEDDYGRVQ